MAGATLSLKVEVDDSAIRAALQRLERAGGDMRTAFIDIGEYLDLSTRQRFDREEAPDGSRWEPLSEATLRRKMLKGVSRGKGGKRKRLTKRGGGTKIGGIRALAGSQILVESSDMRDTLRYNAAKNSLEYGTDRIQGATQHFGREEDGIPARPWLGLSAQDRQEVLNILQAHIEAAMRVQ